MPDDSVSALRSLLDTKRGDYNKAALAKYNDPTQSQSFVTDWSDDRAIVHGNDGTTTAKRVITNGAIGLGDPVTVRGNTADEMPRVKRKVKAETAETVKIKVGYVYQKTVSGSTALFCAASPPAGGGGGSNPTSVNVPYSLPTDYFPIPPGETRMMTIRVNGTSYHRDSSVLKNDGSTHLESIDSGGNPVTTGPFLVTSSLKIQATDGDLSFYSGILTNIEGTQYSIPSSSISSKSGSSHYITVRDPGGAGFFFFDQLTKYNITIVGDSFGETVTVVESWNNLITLTFDSPVNPPPDGSQSDDHGAGDPTTPEDPANPSTPDPGQSYEFWYNSDRASTPIKLKSLAKNQPLEAKPYIYHYSATTSYVILKYGNAGNNGGTAGDWCKMSLFQVVGKTDLSVSETVYQWSTEVSLANQLKALGSPFYAVLASKTKVNDIDLDALVASNDLDAKFRCQTHRNLTNLKKRSPSVFLIDPATDTAQATLAGEDFYTLTQITGDLVTSEQITAIARFFELKTNPDYTGSGEDCASNPAYKLIEKTRSKIKNVKVNGLNSTDSTIKVLTFNCGQV